MNYATGKLISVTPCHPGWHAVYADDAGDPELEPVVCWGIYEFDDEERVVALTRSSTGGASLEPADLDPSFVGVAAPGETSVAWAEACREHFEALGGEVDEGIEGGADEGVQGAHAGAE